MSTRLGASRRARQIERRFFYTQSLVAQGLLPISNIRGIENVADLDTKCLCRGTRVRRRELAGVAPSHSANGSHFVHVVLAEVCGLGSFRGFGFWGAGSRHSSFGIKRRNSLTGGLVGLGTSIAERACVEATVWPLALRGACGRVTNTATWVTTAIGPSFATSLLFPAHDHLHGHRHVVPGRDNAPRHQEPSRLGRRTRRAQACWPRA